MEDFECITLRVVWDLVMLQGKWYWRMKIVEK